MDGLRVDGPPGGGITVAATFPLREPAWQRMSRRSRPKLTFRPVAAPRPAPLASLAIGDEGV